MAEAIRVTPPEKIAIIGIGCRFPGGAGDHRAFWQNLLDGKDCITATPRDRYDVSTLGSRDKAKPGRLVGGRGGYIDGFDEFDPAFFGISPREADSMDPQQRKLLEVAWEALEDGGQKPAELAGRDVGVFIGAFTLDYKILQFADLRFDTLAAHTATGTMMTMVSNRISHCFDFRGPSLSVDTACSSSLVSVHLACESLRRGEHPRAEAGGTCSTSRRSTPSPRPRAASCPPRAAPVRSTPTRTGTSAPKGSESSPSNASPTPSATVTRSTP